MRRLFCLVLALVMVLSLTGCQRAEINKPQEPVIEEPTAEEPVAADTEVEEPVSEPVEPTEEVLPFVDWAGYNPLTGEPTEQEISRQRPVMVMLNNLKQALPQSGNGQADIIYEILEEGGITRMLAVYQDIHSVEGNLGTIRSTRPYYVNLVAGMDGILVHAGGSKAAYNKIDSMGVDHIDALGGAGSGLFWRDKGRLNAGIATEHTMYITASDLASHLTSSSVRMEHREDFSMQQLFVEDAVPADGSAANHITVPFSSYKTGEFIYDDASGKYLVAEYGAPYMDGTSNTQVSVENVLIIMTQVSQIEGDTKGRINVQMTGSGIGYFANGGKYVPINWSRAAEKSQYVFTTLDGEQLNLGIGSSYVNIVPTTCSVSFVG